MKNKSQTLEQELQKEFVKKSGLEKSICFFISEEIKESTFIRICLLMKCFVIQMLNKA